MILRFPSYGALDAFIVSHTAVIVRCWPEMNGEWLLEYLG